MRSIFGYPSVLFIVFLMTTFPQVSYSSSCDTLKPDQAAFFQHSKYKGACVIRNIGHYPSSKEIGIENDKISSIKLGSSTQFVLCRDNNLKGACKAYAKSMISIGKMNDQTSSAIIVSTAPQKPLPYVSEKKNTSLTGIVLLRSRGKIELLAPSSLGVDMVTDTTVTLSWFDDSDREYGVEVYRMNPVEARRNQAVNWVFVGLYSRNGMGLL